MHPVPIAPFIENEHKLRIAFLSRIWIGVLLLQLALIGLTTAAVPKYATGEPALSAGFALSCCLLFALAFFLVDRFERTRLARVPVEIIEASGPEEDARDYVFLDARGALLQALDATLPATLLRLGLVSGISVCAYMMRLEGASLAFALTLLAISLFIQWRIFPSTEATARRLEAIKGVTFPSVTSTRLHPTVHLGVAAEER